VSIVLFLTHSTRPAALCESAPLAPDRSRPLAGDDPGLCEIFFFSLRTAVWVRLVLSQLFNNPLPLSFDDDEDARPRLLELFAATTHIGMIRERSATICFALQDLELPAPLTLEILDSLFPPNEIRMWAKWELITTIKHFHQRHERCWRPTTPPPTDWYFDCFFMAEDFVVETTNERGIVEQTRFSANQTVLQLNGRSLVRIDGLERATTLQRLVVRRPKSTAFLVSNLTHSRSFHSAQHQPLRWRASVCARFDTARASQRESRSPPFVSSLSLLTPLQLNSNSLSSLPAAIGHMTALTELWVRTDTAFALARLIGTVF
jgi:Leucine-rich repeat (LRR) protein